MVKVRNLTESLEKKYKLNESFVEEWWGQTEEDPYDFAEEYGLDIEPIKSKFDSTLFRFSGPKENIDNAIYDGYFYSISENADEGHSEDLDESLDEAWEEEFDDEYDAIMDDDSLSEKEKTEKINSLHQKYNKKNESLNESFWDPTHWFNDLVDNYENWTAEEWNTWDQEKRDMEVTKAIKHFLIDNQLSEEEALEFIDDLDDNNFHTEARIFYDLYNRNNSL